MTVRTRLYTWSKDLNSWVNPQGTVTDNPYASDEFAVGNMAVVGATYQDGRCASGWTNCDDQHLYVVLPSGNVFDFMSRAANCVLPGDTEHRCWVVHGLGTETPTVDKIGFTCVAGAGSVIDGPWHGFLRSGELVPA